MYKVRLAFSILIFIFAIIGMAGLFYPLPFFDFQFAPVIQRIIYDFSIGALAILLVLLSLTLIFGRLYCSLLCPFGIFQEIIALLRKKNIEKKQPNFPVKYYIAAISLGCLIGGSAIIIRYLEPYTYFGSTVTLSVIGIIASVTVLLIAVFKNRFFCTNICPIGCLLGLLSKVSIFKINIDKNNCVSCGKCERNCPSGCIDSKEKTVDNEICVKCLKCVDGLCSKNAITYSKGVKAKIEFNSKRRELITAGFALVILAGAIKAGIDISKSAAKKIRDVILPPGSENAQRMFNKCLNCNLCIGACPNKILQKADEHIGVVHIDYEKGKKYCKYDCNECSKVCPSGAIKKITIEEKQKSRIAMAVINADKCNGCSVCAGECPANAITRNERGKAIINSSKCIGCGKCKISCSFGAIDVFAINEQQKV